MSLGRHTAYNLVGSLIPLAISVVTVPIYMKVIGAERYGVLAICWLLLGYFGMFDLGLGRAVAFRLATLRDQLPQARADAAWTAVVVSGTMGLIGAGVFWAGAGAFFSHSLKAGAGVRAEVLASLPLLIFAVPIAVVTAVLSGALQGRQRFLQINSVSVTSSSLSQVLPLLLAVTLGPRLSVVLSGAIISRLLGVAAFAFLCRAEFWRASALRVRLSEAKQLLLFGGWVSLNGMLTPMIAMADRLLIGAVLGAREVAAYAVPYSVAERISILPYALTTALFPRMSAETPAEQERLGEQTLRLLVAAMTVPILAGVFLAEPLLQLWLGSSYDPRSAGVARILLINFWAASFSLITHVRLQAAGRPAVLTKVLAIQTPIYLLALYAGIMWFGLIGCAFALLGRCILNYVQTSWAANRRLVGWPVLLVNLTVLLIAHFAARAWAWNDWRLWSLAALLLLISGASTWRNLPLEVKQTCARILGPLWRTAT